MGHSYVNMTIFITVLKRVTTYKNVVELVYGGITSDV